MTAGGEDDGGGEPRRVIPLEYGGRADDAVAGVVRFAAACVAVQGATVAAASGWSAARLMVVGSGAPGQAASDEIGCGVEVAKACVGVGLIVAGLLARGRREAGRQWCVVGEAALAGLFVAETAVWLWQLEPAQMGWTAARFWGGDYVLSTAVEVVLPIVACVGFRRPEVRATFDR